jgi:hypothetical protein
MYNIIMQTQEGASLPNTNPELSGLARAWDVRSLTPDQAQEVKVALATQGHSLLTLVHPFFNLYRVEHDLVKTQPMEDFVTQLQRPDESSDHPEAVFASLPDIPFKDEVFQDLGYRLKQALLKLEKRLRETDEKVIFLAEEETNAPLSVTLLQRMGFKGIVLLLPTQDKSGKALNFETSQLETILNGLEVEQLEMAGQNMWFGNASGEQTHQNFDNEVITIEKDDPEAIKLLLGCVGRFAARLLEASQANHPSHLDTYVTGIRRIFVSDMVWPQRRPSDTNQVTAVLKAHFQSRT